TRPPVAPAIEVNVPHSGTERLESAGGSCERPAERKQQRDAAATSKWRFMGLLLVRFGGHLSASDHCRKRFTLRTEEVGGKIACEKGIVFCAGKGLFCVFLTVDLCVAN